GGARHGHRDRSMTAPQMVVRDEKTDRTFAVRVTDAGNHPVAAAQRETNAILERLPEMLARALTTVLLEHATPASPARAPQPDPDELVAKFTEAHALLQASGAVLDEA